MILKKYYKVYCIFASDCENMSGTKERLSCMYIPLYPAFPNYD